MISTTIFPSRYIQGSGAIQRLGEEAKRLGESTLLIVDPYVFDHLLSDFRSSLTEALNVTFERFEGEASDEEVARLVEVANGANADVIIGIGGGKSLDTAKAVAHNMKAPVIIVPTIASTDAPCSALSVIYTPEGAFKRYLVLPHNPEVVLVDSEIIAQAPVRFLIAGIGDALSTWFEADACQRNYAPNMTGDIGSSAAYHLARFCYDMILEYGVAAKVSCEAKVVTPALERVIEANTLLSGLGFESGGLASCHAIHNGLTTVHQTHDYWHGEKVTIGVLTSLFLTDRPAALIDEVYTFCEAVGLPTTLAEIGLENPTDEDLIRVAEGACAEGETIYHEPMPMSPEKVFAALKAADAEGRRRKEVQAVENL
jgi:glycerol dehydrogenase